MSDTTLTREQWDTINTKLREPFDPALISFRPQGKPNAQGKAEILAYIDARDVQDRLDDAVGAGNWSFDWQPIIVERGDVQVAKGIITIHGVSMADAGTASNFEQSLGAVSHCFKRAAVHWGVGRYLYDLPSTWETVGKNGRIDAATLTRLRSKLPTPPGYTPTASTATTAPASTTTSTNTAKRQPTSPQPRTQSKKQPEPEPQDDAPVDPSLDTRLDAILKRHPDLKRMYFTAGKYGLRGNAFFTEFVRVAGIVKKDLLEKPVTAAHKDAMGAYVTRLAEEAKAAAARTPDLATVATPAVRA